MNKICKLLHTATHMHELPPTWCWLFVLVLNMSLVQHAAHSKPNSLLLNPNSNCNHDRQAAPAKPAMLGMLIFLNVWGHWALFELISLALCVKKQSPYSFISMILLCWHSKDPDADGVRTNRKVIQENRTFNLDQIQRSTYSRSITSVWEV